MLQVTNIRVKTFNLSHLDIFWSIQDTTEDARGYEFYVQKSVNEYGPFGNISGAIIDQFHFRDTTVRGQHAFFHKVYYRLRVVDRESQDERFFPDTGRGVNIEVHPDLMALEMARQENLKLEEFKGRAILLFPRRTFGTRCVACFDNLARRRIRSNCQTCYNTGFAGGYFAPIRCFMKIIAPDEIVVKTNVADLQTQTGSFQLGNFPLLHEGDLVVEAENLRWSINPRIKKVRKGRAVIRQEGTLFRVPKDNAEYSVPVNKTLMEMGDEMASPDRNYTNPHNLGDVSLTKALNFLFGSGKK